MKANELHDNRFSGFLYDHPKYSNVLNIYSDEQTQKMMFAKGKKLSKAGHKAEKSGNKVFAKAYQKQADHVNHEANYNILQDMAYDKRTIENSNYGKMSPMNKEQLAKRITQTLPHDKNIQKFVRDNQDKNHDLCKVLERHPRQAKELDLYSSKLIKPIIKDTLKDDRQQLAKTKKQQSQGKTFAIDERDPNFYQREVDTETAQLKSLKPDRIYGGTTFIAGVEHPHPFKRSDLLDPNCIRVAPSPEDTINYFPNLVKKDKFEQLSPAKQQAISKQREATNKEAKRVRPFEKYDDAKKYLKEDQSNIKRFKSDMTPLLQRHEDRETIFEDNMDVGNSKDKIFPQRALEYVHYEDNKHAEDKNYGIDDRFKNLTTNQQKTLAKRDMHDLSQFSSVINKNGDKAKFLDKHPNVKVRLNLQTKRGQVVRKLPENHNGVAHKGGFSKHFNNQNLSEMTSKGYKLANVQSMFGSKSSYKKSQNHSLKKYGIDNHSKGQSKSASVKHGKRDSRYNRVLKKLLSAKHNIDKGVKEDREKHESSKSVSRGDGFDRE